MAHLIVICGATASGKTDLAIRIAQHFDAEILSCDARQFYQEMSIGTAKPTPQELAQVPHHFVDNISIEDTYNVGTYEKEAIHFLETYFKNKQVAVLVGGSGLFMRALCEGIDEYPDVPEAIREQLQTLLEKEGIEALQALLKTQDIDYYNIVDLKNPHRLIRALEVCLATGKPFSSFQQRTPTQRPFQITKIGIDWERAQLNARIDQRVEMMMQQGLLDEVKQLYPKRHLLALQTVGYQELFDYLDNKMTLKEAVEWIKIHTRQYAKRQGTWFRKEKEVQWFDAPIQLEQITHYLENQLNKHEQ